MNETKKELTHRHKELVSILDRIVECARDSDMMDVSYYAHKIEELLKETVPSIKIPPNEWIKRPQQGANPDRLLMLDLYISTLKSSLKSQGFRIEEFEL